MNNVKCIQHSIFVYEFSESEILGIINNKLDDKLSSGPDDFPPMLINKLESFLFDKFVFQL